MLNNSLFPQSPQNYEAEVGVLGSILLENSIASDILPILNKSYFSSDNHQLIFDAICFLFENNQPIDTVFVEEELKRRGCLEQAGGHIYLLNLMGAVSSAGNAVRYAEIVRDKGIMRLLIKASEQIIEYSKTENMNLDDLLDKSEQLIFEITQKKLSSDPTHIGHLVKNLLNLIEQNSYGMKGVPTGFGDLDKIISGFLNSSLIIIAGRPSMGKSTFALNIATYVGAEQNIGVLVFSLEMSKEQVAQNIICSRAKVSPYTISGGKVENQEYKRLTDESTALEQSPIFIDDTPALSIRELRAKSRKYKSQYNIGLVIIDYIQLMESPGNSYSENRQQEISQISRGLKGLARELDIPIVALSQLNRAVDARDEHRPRMSDLRESGALEQDADLILFLYRDEYYNKDSPKKDMAEVIVAKHRNGPIGSVELYFFKQYMRFVSVNYSSEFLKL